MNPKTAKRLRKAARYHPSQPREYITVNNTRRNTPGGGTVELADSCSRLLYQELKKEYKNGN